MGMSLFHKETASYPAEGKVSFSRRKKRLPIVAFIYLCTYIYARSLKDQARKSKYPRTKILDPRT